MHTKLLYFLKHKLHLFTQTTCYFFFGFFFFKTTSLQTHIACFLILQCDCIKLISHTYFCRRKFSNRVIRSSLSPPWNEQSTKYIFLMCLHTKIIKKKKEKRRKPCWNQPELTEESLALSAVLFSPFPRLTEKRCSRLFSAPAQEKWSVSSLCSPHRATSHCRNSLYRHFEDTTDEGCNTAVTGLISRIKCFAFLFFEEEDVEKEPPLKVTPLGYERVQ